MQRHRSRPSESLATTFFHGYFDAPPADSRYRAGLLRGVHHAWARSERNGPPTAEQLAETLRPFVAKHKPEHVDFPFLDSLVRSGHLQNANNTYRLTADGIADIALNNVEEDWYQWRIAAAGGAGTVTAALFGGAFMTGWLGHFGKKGAEALQAKMTIQTRLNTQVAKLITALPESERAQFSRELAKADP